MTIQSKSAVLKIVKQCNIIIVKSINRADRLALFKRKLRWHNNSKDIIKLVVILKFMPLVIA
jgi:hypothetical protein